jgi:3-methyladenine DNA glycosylase/8-oxoguanine DNA glycosylase
VTVTPERVVRTRRPVDLGLTLGLLAHGGRFDRTVRIGARDAWRATDTPAGVATVHLQSNDEHTVRALAWGPGADAALDAVPDLVGADDDPPSLAGVHPLVTEIERRRAGLRIGRTGAVFDALVPTVLAQKVVGLDASAAYRAMVRAAGRVAPMPTAGAGLAVAPPMLLPPTAAWLSTTPYWTFHQWGVEQKRAGTIKAAAGNAAMLDGVATAPIADARFALFGLPGVGPWTVNTVAMLALGDPDAVSVGDYWLKHIVTYALTGEPRGTDERMLELLEPWRGQRGRVCRLLMSGGPRLPRFGPRLARRTIAAH